MRSTKFKKPTSITVHNTSGLAVLSALLSSLSSQAVAAPFTLEEAIRSAWKGNPGIASSTEAVAAARADVESARDGRLPSLMLSAKAVATKEPVAAFGMKLDEQRITAGLGSGLNAST